MAVARRFTNFQHNHGIANLRLDMKAILGLDALQFLCAKHLFDKVKKIKMAIEIGPDCSDTVTDV